MDSKMVSVVYTDNNTGFKKKPQVLDREFVERFNVNKDLTKKEYKIDKKLTEAYYKTKLGKIQEGKELMDKVNSDDTDKVIKSVDEAKQIIKNKK